MEQTVNVRRTDGTIIKTVSRRLSHINHRGKIITFCTYGNEPYRVHPDGPAFQIVVPCVDNEDVRLDGLKFYGGDADNDGD